MHRARNWIRIMPKRPVADSSLVQDVKQTVRKGRTAAVSREAAAKALDRGTSANPQQLCRASIRCKPRVWREQRDLTNRRHMANQKGTISFTGQNSFDNKEKKG